MDKINEPAGWPDIPLLSTRDLVLGGEEGPSNAQAKAISARLNQLKEVGELVEGVPLVPEAEWEPVPAFKGGPDAPLNRQANALANRTELLKSATLSYKTFQDADYFAKRLTDGVVIHAPDEDGRLAFFEVLSGELVFIDYAPDVIRLQSYSALRTYRGKSESVDIFKQGIAGRFYCMGVIEGATDNGGTRIIDGLGRLWERSYAGDVLIDWFDIPESGDVTEHVQKSVDSGLNIKITPRKYDVQGTVIANQRGQKIYGVTGLALGTEQTSASSILGGGAPVFASNRNDGSPTFLVRGHHVSFSGIGFFGQNDDTFNQTAIKFERGVSVDDMDGLVEDCVFFQFHKPIEHVGRGLHCHDNIFASCTYTAVVSWPTSGASTDPEKSPPLGHRAFRYYSNRIHACDNGILVNGSTPPRGALIANNVADKGHRLIESLAGLIFSDITGNVLDMCNKTPVVLAGEVDTLNFVGNEVGGVRGDIDRSPTTAIWFNNATSVKNINVATNIFHDLDGGVASVNSQTEIVGFSFVGNECAGLEQNGTPTSLLQFHNSVNGLKYFGNTSLSGCTSTVVGFTSPSCVLRNSLIDGNVWDQAKTLLGAHVDGGGNTIIRRNGVYGVSALGRFGVGTDSPFRKLTVSDSVATIQRLERTGSTGGVGLEFTNSNGSIRLFGAVSSEDNGNINFGVDNTVAIGNASYRVKEVHAGNGTIITSDEREKTELRPASEVEKAAALEIKRSIGAFQFLASIAEKGEDGARIHWGVGAQTVGVILSRHGLDPAKYAFWCWDEWTDDSGVARERFGVRLDQLAMFILAAM